MSNIEVPYLPISSFDASSVAKCFSEELANDDNSNGCFMSSLKTADEDDISEEILLILTGMGMEKYIALFQKEHILLDTFLQLNDSDLLEIGITDPEDREIITKNLSVHRKTENYCVVPENHIEDLKIMKNISRQILVLQNYCAYVELQLKKHKLTDYKINVEESASTYLRAFTESALVQSKILCDTIYGQQNFNSLIDKVLQANNLVLPEALQKSLPKRTETYACGFCVFKLMAVVGFASAAVLIGKYFISNWKAA